MKIIVAATEFVAAICRTNSNWFEFVRHIAATKEGQATCRSNSADEATCRSNSADEATCRSDSADEATCRSNSADEATCRSNSADEATCRSDVSPRFVASCASALKALTIGTPKIPTQQEMIKKVKTN